MDLSLYSPVARGTITWENSIGKPCENAGEEEIGNCGQMEPNYLACLENTYSSFFFNHCLKLWKYTTFSWLRQKKMSSVSLYI